MRSKDGAILQSFEWLEDAMEAYPTATLLPLLQVAPDPRNPPPATEMMPGTSPNHTYPTPPVLLDRSDNAERITRFLQSTLHLSRQQIQHSMAFVWDIPCPVLQERLQFLLTAAPKNDSSSMLTTSEPVDWPVAWEQHQRGAGLTAHQVVAVIPQLPQLLLHPMGLRSMSQSQKVSMMAFLYESLPNVVLDMVRTQLEPDILGASNEDTLAFAYLHWRGWDWLNCRVVLAGLPSIISTSMQPGWEVVNRNAKLPSELRRDATEYMLRRLQLRPWQVHAMIRTHPTLLGYSKELLERRVNSFGSLLAVRSSTLRRLVLRQPSLLGMSVEAIESRVLFWRHAVGVDQALLESLALRVPALLQYSVEENLTPKLDFLRHTLQLDDDCIRRITRIRPDIWGRSLKRHYIPWVEAFAVRLGITEKELGQIIGKAPNLLLCSWKGNLVLKIDYLQTRLGLGDADLKWVIQSSPQTLMQAIETSLEEKIKLVEETAFQLGQSDGASTVFVTNPSLFVTTTRNLQKRIDGITDSYSSCVNRTHFPALFQSRARPSKRTLCLVRATRNTNASGTVENYFQTVAEAAEFCAMSRSNMYRVIRKGLCVSIDGIPFRVDYASNVIDHPQEAALSALSSGEPLASTASSVLEQASIPSYEDVDSPLAKVSSAVLRIGSSGRAYPPEDSVRGRRRSGGMALQISLEGTGTDSQFWRSSAERLYKGQPFKVFDDQVSVLILLGYPYTRPSRSRCSLYVIREALRIAREWVLKTPHLDHQIVVETDSTGYVATLLQNDLLAKWGIPDDIKAFMKMYQGPTEHLYQANPDILYPLARLYRSFYAKNIPVNFEAHPSHPRLKQGALLAAKRMFKSV